MRLYKDLYIGEKVEDKIERIKWNVEHNAGLLSIYLITLPSNGENLMDIIPATDLLQRAYPKRELFIIGIEKGYTQAAYMAAAIVSDVYTRTGTLNVKQFILQQEADH